MQEIVLPIIEKQIGDGSSLSWIYNVLNGEKEKERQVERGIFSGHFLLSSFHHLIHGYYG